MSERPNILFIMTDDHASHAMSCYNSRINETPNLDRIAEGGMRFNNCFCTNSICAPSRAVILTGTYNHINGVTTLRTIWTADRSHFPNSCKPRDTRPQWWANGISDTAGTTIPPDLTIGTYSPVKARITTHDVRHGQRSSLRRIHHRHHNRPRTRLVKRPRQKQTLHAHVSPQSTPSSLGARRQTRGHVRRHRHPRTRNPVGRLQQPRHSRIAG